MLRWSHSFLACLPFLVIGCILGLPLQPEGPRATPKQVNAFATASNAFAFDLYAKLSPEKGDLFFSPYSMSTALAMTSAGARGQTLADMNRVLHFPDQAELHPAVSTLTADMRHRAGRNVDLSIANALWIQKGEGIREEFLALTRDHYQAGCQLVDFIKYPDSCRRTINDWTETQTHRRIRDLLSPTAITPNTRLILTNAIYFKANWDKGFDKHETRDDDFHVAGGGTVKKPLMHQTDEFGYATAADLQILEMPYVGKDFGLVILLPTRGTPLAKVETNMANHFNEWLAGLSPEKVIVTVPKFELTAEMSMNDVLSRMGISVAFSGDADFSGIEDVKLCLQDVIHKAFVEVNEKGTEAAAATAVEMTFTAQPPGFRTPLPEFTADRPFVYLIRDRHTGAILFLGRYVGQ
jgi:serpin B